MFPSSLLFLICILAAAFVASFSFAIYTQRKSRDTYNKMGAMDSPGGKLDPAGVGSRSPGTVVYQKAGADYAIPQSQNVVTYCVIDDRLVDQWISFMHKRSVVT